MLHGEDDNEEDTDGEDEDGLGEDEDGEVGERENGGFHIGPQARTFIYGFDDNADPAQKTQFRFNRRN